MIVRGYLILPPSTVRSRIPTRFEPSFRPHPPSARRTSHIVPTPHVSFRRQFRPLRGVSHKFHRSRPVDRTRMIRFGCEILEITSLRPNPAQDELEIDLQSAARQDANIEILNALGAKVYSDTKNIISGASSIHLDTRSLSSGVYLVRVGGVSQSLIICR